MTQTILLFHDKSNAPKGLPWAVKILEAKENHPASDVKFNVPTTTFYMDSTETQKWYVKAVGKLRWEGTVAIVESGD